MTTKQVALFASLSLVLTLSVPAYAGFKEPDYPEKKGKIIHAVFCNPHTPVIDGKLDDPIWQQISPTTDFVQTEPEEGVAPTEKTELRIAYDRHAIYVAVHAYDSEPQKITTKLNRRDRLDNSDYIRLFFDSQHDHQTAFVFGTNPSGVQFDSFISNDGEGGHGRMGRRGDTNWDAVWDVETRIDSTGWCAEFRIPLSMLRYPPIANQTWGFNFQRVIERKREEIWWVMRPRGASGLVSRFGHLTDLNGLVSPRRLELLPYFTAKNSWTAGKSAPESFYGTGADFKYGISSGVTLDATINPDFGQVEADPEVLNLSVFETFYPEKRPFFIEGAHLFSTPFRLFHSRRIGRRPGTYSVRSGDQILDKPDFTTIYAATKITGKTPGGVSFALLDGLTAPEYARVLAPAQQADTVTYHKENRLIEPLTNYFVARATQDLWRGNSRVGVLMTATNRQGPPPGQSQSGVAQNAYSGGIDWNLWTADGQFNLSGQSAFSLRQLEHSWERGYAFQASFGREGGKIVHGGFRLSAISPSFNINDLGYNRRNNIISTGLNVRFFTTDYHWITRRIFLSFSADYNQNFQGLVLNKSVNMRNFFIFRNYWSFSYRLSKDFDVYDDLKTRGGPPILEPGTNSFSVSMDTDRRRMVQIRLEYSHNWHRFGSHRDRYQFDLNLKPNERIVLSFRPRYTYNLNVAQWVTNIDEDGDGIKDTFVFGELHNRLLDLTMRANVTFTRKMSLQIYMQPFLTTGDYTRYRALARPSSFEFRPYPLEDRYDFRIASFKSNLVFRWEYRPGSTLYLVWARNLRQYSGDATFRPYEDLQTLFRQPGNNTVMIKWNYWLNI